MPYHDLSPHAKLHVKNGNAVGLEQATTALASGAVPVHMSSAILGWKS